MKITLLILTLNEIDGVKEIMPRVKNEWVDEIIIIDGNSTDGTFEYFESNGYTVFRQTGPGILSAYWQGFDAATGDVIIPFSPDGNSIPEAIPLLIAKMREGYDMVIASRYKGDAQSDDDDWLTGLGNRVFTKTVSILFKADYTDALVIYRAFRTELVDTLGFNKPKKALLFELPLSIRCAKLKLKVTEIPSSEPMRIGPGGSRAHPGFINKLKAGSIMLYIIFHEFIFWRREC
ncbi:MAG: glycosyltransferase family 2 protein [Pseudomonadota bacterium]|nr:glycosyltransferase family 2 protein [Pseudomonadota bacterium]